MADLKAGSNDTGNVDNAPDRILLSVFSHRFMSVAEVGLGLPTNFWLDLLIRLVYTYPVPTPVNRQWEQCSRRLPSRKVPD